MLIGLYTDYIGQKREGSRVAQVSGESMKKLSSAFIVASIITCILTISQAIAACAAPASGFATNTSQPGKNFYLLHNGMAATSWFGPDGINGINTYSKARILQTKVKTADRKDLLIGVSLQSGTYTAAKSNGNNGSTEQAGPMTAIEVHVKIDGQRADPDTVIFAKSAQELTAELGGVIQKCTPVCSTGLTYDDIGNLSGSVITCKDIIIAKDCVVTDEEIGLMLSTTSANHFNFMAPNLEAGEHTVEVYAKSLSPDEVASGSLRIPVFDDEGNIIRYVYEGGTTGKFVRSSALVKLGSLTVEEVRAVNNPDGAIVALGGDATEFKAKTCDPETSSMPRDVRMDAGGRTCMKR